MNAAYEAAKKAVMARQNDPHMEQCEHCKPYVDDLIRNEIEQMESARKDCKHCGRQLGTPNELWLKVCHPCQARAEMTHHTTCNVENAGSCFAPWCGCPCHAPKPT